MFATTEFFHGCYPIQCSKCGGALTPPFLQKAEKRMVKGCVKCRDVVDITEAWLENARVNASYGNNSPKDTTHIHKDCGGKMVCVLDPDTFKLVYFCFKCGTDIRGIEEMADGQLLEKS